MVRSNQDKHNRPLKCCSLFSVFLTAVALLTACTAHRQHQISSAHVQNSTPKAPNFSTPTPPPISDAHFVPPPSPQAKIEYYTVIVDNVPVRELLFSIARDAKLNLDIDTDIDGTVTMNFVDKTLPSILDRISELQPIRYQLDGKDLRIRVDKPYLKTYRLNYLNMGRNSSSEVTVSTQISSTGQGAATESSDGSGNNNSTTSVINQSNHQFWNTITSNIDSLIQNDRQDNSESENSSSSSRGSSGRGFLARDDDNGESRESSSDSSSSSSSSNEASNTSSNPNIIVNREAGLLAVNATAKQHRKIQSFLDDVLGSIGRQVMIEATIAEVSLSDRYQAGVDWRALQTTGTAGIDNFSNPDGINILQSMTSTSLTQAPTFFFRLTETDINGNRLDATLRALEQFGDVKIMSSPKIMALNNQTALLKVVDNEVYFSIEVDTTVSDSGATTVEFETNIETVPVGFVMSVTPFIDELSTVTLNVRPTISRIIGRVQDPNPDLANAGVVSEIPVIQVREIESILKIRNGQTAVIGGLMQDDISEQTSGVPVLSSIPYLGKLFSYTDDQYTKTELVIFIRPVVVKDANINTGLNSFKQYTSFLDP